MSKDVQIRILKALLDEVTKKYDFFIENRERLYKQAYELAVKDPLTGLYNRHYLEDYAKKLISKALRNKNEVSLMFLDLDNFKPINDTYGHEKGDEALKEVAEIFSSKFRDSDVISRFGGDEFIFLFDSDISEERIIKLRKLIEEKFKDYGLSFSYGIAKLSELKTPIPDAGKALKELIQLADSRMYASKKERKKRRKGD